MAAATCNLLDTNNGVENSSDDGVVISAGATGNAVKSTRSRAAATGSKSRPGTPRTTLSENKAYLEWLNDHLILGSDIAMSLSSAD